MKSEGESQHLRGSRAREIREAMQRFFYQELGSLDFAFLALVVKYLEPHPDAWGFTQTRGVRKGRVLIRPKHRRFKHDGEEVELRTIWDVPVCFYKTGDFTYRFPLHKGDVVYCVVSETALESLIVDHKTALRLG